MRVNALFAMGMVTLLFCAGLTAAEAFTVGESYESVDTLAVTDLWNEYLITADSDKDVKYSVEVQGAGQVMVFFMPGHGVGLDDEYYVVYSADDPRTSYSNSFPVSTDDGTRFTLLVMTGDDFNVTYEISIEVKQTFFTNTVCYSIIAVVLVIVGVLYLFGRKKKAEEVPLEEHLKQPEPAEQPARPAQPAQQKKPAQPGQSGQPRQPARPPAGKP